METRQGKIEEKFLKFATNKAPYATFVIDGLKYNTFDQEIIDNHNPDDFVEFTGEVRGKFWAMETMKKIDEPTRADIAQTIGKMVGNGAKEYHLSPEEVKCRALECSIKYWKDVENAQPTQDTILMVADKFVEWIYGNHL